MSNLCRYNRDSRVVIINLMGVGPRKCHPLGTMRRRLETRVIGSGGTRGVVTSVGTTGTASLSRCGTVPGTIDSSLGVMAFTTPTCMSTLHDDRPLINTCTSITRMGGLDTPVGNGTNMFILRMCNGSGLGSAFGTGSRRTALTGVRTHFTDHLVGSLCLGKGMGSAHCLFFWSLVMGAVATGNHSSFKGSLFYWLLRSHYARVSFVSLRLRVWAVGEEGGIWVSSFEGSSYKTSVTNRGAKGTQLYHRTSYVITLQWRNNLS